MDRTELKAKLIPFQEKCKQIGRQLSELGIEEAFPGDDSTSWIIKVKAPWIDAMNCSGALDFLFETLWKTVDESTRENIFSIHVLNSSDELHSLMGESGMS